MSETPEVKNPLELVGPRVRSLLNLLIVGGALVEATEEARRARLAGRTATSPKPTKGPLEEVMTRVGIEVPDLESLLSRILGDSPEAKQRAAEIIKSQDMAALFQAFLARAGVSAIEDATKAGPGATPPQPGPVVEQGGAPEGPSAEEPVFDPPNAHPAPLQQVAPQPPQQHAHAQPYQVLMQQLDYRPDYDAFGKGPPPGWQPPVVHRPPPPPPPTTTTRATPKPGWTTFGKLPTRPRPESKTDEPTATASAVGAASSERDELKVLVVRLIDKVEAIESRMDARFTELLRHLDDLRSRICRLELSIEALKAERTAKAAAGAEEAAEAVEIVENADVAEVVEMTDEVEVIADEAATTAEGQEPAEAVEVEVGEVEAEEATDVEIIDVETNEAPAVSVKDVTDVSAIEATDVEIIEAAAVDLKGVTDVSAIEATEAEVVAEVETMTQVCGRVVDKCDHIEHEVVELATRLSLRLHAAEAELAELKST